MHAEVISVGTEILLGQITDTNSTFISQRLAELGIDVYFKTVVGDNEKRLLLYSSVDWGLAGSILSALYTILESRHISGPPSV